MDVLTRWLYKPAQADPSIPRYLGLLRQPSATKMIDRRIVQSLDIHLLYLWLRIHRHTFHYIDNLRHTNRLLRYYIDPLSYYIDTFSE